MRCPFCQHRESRVVDSRTSGEGIRRRRECEHCGRRFTTHEHVERRMPMVVKKDGRREVFEREKLLKGLELACRKRPISAVRVHEAADDVERAIFENSDREVASVEIGRHVLEALSSLDPVAYLRFASVYQELESAEAFLELVRVVTEGRTG